MAKTKGIRMKKPKLSFIIFIAISTLAVLSPNTANAQSGSAMGGQTKAMGILSAGMNVATGKMLYSQCAACSAKHPCPWLCVMGAMSYAQAGVALMSALSGSKTQSGFAGGGTGVGGWEGGNPDWDNWPTLGQNLSGEDLKLYNDIAGGLKEGEKKGYKFDPKKNTLTDPSGKAHNVASIGSLQGMVDAGLMKPEDIPEAEKAIAAAADKYKVVPVGLAGGGGGGLGGAGSRAGSSSFDDPYAAYLKQLAGKPQDPKTAGLTRSLASGEVIGASTDNIFEMVHRTYRRKAEEKIFIGQQ